MNGRALWSVALALSLAVFLGAAGTTLTTLYFPPSDSGAQLDAVMRGQFAAILAEIEHAAKQLEKTGLDHTARQAMSSAQDFRQRMGERIKGKPLAAQALKGPAGISMRPAGDTKVLAFIPLSAARKRAAEEGASPFDDTGNSE